MRTVGVIVAAVALAAACAASMPREQATAPTFEEFKAVYGRTYQTPQEEAKRRDIYEATLQRIKRARVANPFATFGVNELADRDPKEIVGKVRPAKNGRRAAVPVAAPVRGGIPKEVDWRTRGAVTPVVNEGVCGSIICGLTFAANVEGVWAASGLPLTPLSVMPGMMCAYPGLCGCFLRETYDYFLNNQSGFVQTAASWPMNTSQCEATGQCRRDDRHYGARIRSVVQLASNEDIMAESVANNGPITVEVNALPWQTYTGGVMTECTCDDPQPDHVGTIVGYNDAHQPPYWIIKNSWGTNWGENGYIYLEKGRGLCNVTVAPMTVTV